MKYLQLLSLRSGYEGSLVLDGVDLGFDKCELVGVVGPNGAGKSTLLKTIVGLTTILDGDVKFKGKTLSILSTSGIARKGVILVQQGIAVFKSMNVKENLEVTVLAQGKSARPRTKLDEVLALIPSLSSCLHRRAGELSGGQQKLLAIARALMVSPDLLLLDEPTAGLYYDVAEQVLETLASIQLDKRLTIILAEQRMDLIKSRVSRLIGMRLGTVVLDGIPSDLTDSLIFKKVFDVESVNSG